MSGLENRLPTGLPLRLMGGAEGFDALCFLLGIQTRQEKQRILNHPAVKPTLKLARPPYPPDTKTAERIRLDLSLLFATPSMRQSIWKDLYKATRGFEESVRGGMPSLEYMALRNFGAELSAKNTDGADLTDCDEFVEIETDPDEWQIPALFALPAVRADLGNWDSLNGDRQRDAVLAAFAVASILDDSRLLHWAAGENETLAAEFSFACKVDETKAENGDMMKNEVGPVAAEGEIGKKVEHACKGLIDAAGELRRAPLDLDLFDEVSSAAKSVEALREAAMTAAETADSEALIERLVGFFEEHSKGVPSLTKRAEEIGELWKSVFLANSASLADAEARARRQAGESFRVWADARSAFETAVSQFKASEEKLAAAPSDMAAELEAAKCKYEHLSTRKEVLEAEERILASMCPPGYEGQLSKGLRAESSGKTTPDARVEAEGSPGGMIEKIDTGTGETVEVSRAEAIQPDSEGEHPGDEAEGNKPTGLKSGAQTATAENGSHSRKNSDILSGTTRATKQDTVADGEASQESDAERDTESTLARWEIALWECVRDGRIGIAYNIARLAPPDENGGGRCPPPELLGAAGLGACLREPDSEIAQAFKGHAEILYDNLGFRGADYEMRDALNLLLFTAGLRPAIFAPYTGGLQILKGVELSSELTPVYELATAVAGHAERLQGIRFGADRLQSVLDASAWDKRWAEYQGQLAEWRAGLQKEQFLYGPARRVWMRWQYPDGILNKLSDAVSRDSAEGVNRVHEIVGKLDDAKSLHKLVQETHRQDKGVKSSRIFGRALKQIERDATKAVKLGRDWLRLANSRPNSDDFVDQVAESLRQDIDKLGPVAVSAINRLQDDNSNTALSAGLSCARRATEGLIGLFQDGRDSDLSREGDAVALSHSLLYVTALDVTPDFEIAAKKTPEDVLALLADTDAHLNSFTEAFDARLSRGDVVGAKMTHRLLHGGDARDREAREKRLSDTVVARRKSLNERLNDLSEKLEQAYVAVEMTDSEHGHLNAAIVHARNAPNDEDPVEDVERTVAGFGSEIEEWFEKGVTDIRARVGEFPRREDEREQTFLDEAVKTGDLITLHELYGRLNARQPLLPEGGEERRGLRLFLAAVPDIEVRRITPDAAIRSVSKQKDSFGLEFSALSSEQATRSERLLSLWYSLARIARVDREGIQQFLSHLGFEVKTCTVEGNAAVVVETEPLRDRSLCPLHTFGSGLDGRYWIVLNFHPQAHEPIVQALSKIPPMEHPLVFHFGCLGESRESLRVWGTRNGRNFLTVDTTLLLYLASLPSNWLRTFFDCTLPFSAAEPFVTGTAGLVPPELFYGRAKDRESIMDRFGSCFVYGGRQLGKTALLRSASALFDRPDVGQLARWVDLKARDVGVAHGADHIWNVIWEVFKNLGVIEEARRIPKRTDEAAKIAMSAVGEWIGGSTDRRILLLLDEADPFLAADSENDFRESVRLKGAMDDTERKFKVVFSGLHNVLRTTERANHPLAHFGEPICVGPLLHNGEWEQARALIGQPLAAVGCVFEKDSLTTHILAWTNYYPSLIQLFGAELVNHLRGAAGRTVPYKVNMNDINAVWANENLRVAILDKFRLTLNLDERYLVTACALAFELQDKYPVPSSGLLQQELFDSVFTWWPEGFEISDREFGGLLGEMQGLGVLRAERDGDRRWRYGFRNPNMHRLFEDAVDIQAELTKEHALPDAFDKHTFYAKYPSDSDKPSAWRRAPLSFEQEGKLRRTSGVTVVAGTAAANIWQLEEYLRDSLSGEEHVFGKLELTTNEAEFVRQLGLKRPRDRSLHIYLVHENTPWAFQWVERTAGVLRRLKRGRAMRVVFQASPPALWQFMSGLPDYYGEESEDLFEWVELLPWNRAFLRRWLSDNNLLVDTRQVDWMLEVYGGWPTVLENYGRTSALGSWEAKNESALTHIKENRDSLLGELGLEQIEVRRQIAALRDYTMFTETEAQDLSSHLADTEDSNVDGSNLIRRLRWAKRLGLLQNKGGAWDVNPLLKNLLESDDE